MLFFILTISILNYNALGAVFSKSLFEDKKNPNIIEGHLTMKRDFYDALSALYANNTVLDQGIVVELWSVVYRDQPIQAGVKQSVGIFLAEKQTSIVVNKSVQLSANNSVVSYNISNIPEQGNYVILVYFDKIPTAFASININGHGDDGSGRHDLIYKSDAKIYIGKEKAWGMYSVPQFSTRLPAVTGLDFDTLSSNGVSINGFFGFLDDIYDFFADLFEVVFCGIKILSGIFFGTNGTGDIVQNVLGSAITLIADRRVPCSRFITEDEYNWANKVVFNGTLPLRERIIITNLRFFKANTAVTLPGTTGLIYMHFGEDYDNPRKDAYTEALFIHELTHVWQYSHYGLVKYVEEGLSNQTGANLDEIKINGCPQPRAYYYQCGKQWSEYNFEQQACIVQDFFWWKEHGNYQSFITCSKYYSENFINNNCTPCQQKFVIETIRSGSRYNLTGQINDVTSGNRIQLYQGKYSISPNLRISKPMTIGACGGTAIIGKN